jgi:hypothetical protein
MWGVGFFMPCDRKCGLVNPRLFSYATIQPSLAGLDSFVNPPRTDVLGYSHAVPSGLHRAHGEISRHCRWSSVNASDPVQINRFKKANLDKCDAIHPFLRKIRIS